MYAFDSEKWDQPGLRLSCVCAGPQAAESTALGTMHKLADKKSERGKREVSHLFREEPTLLLTSFLENQIHFFTT